MTPSSGTIYIIDDDADLASSISRMFLRHAFRAIPYSDPSALLADRSITSPCCVICDVMMGVHNGFDLVRQLRSDVPALAVIFITAWPRTSDAVHAIRDLGGIDYLEKPLDQDALMNAALRGLAWSQKRHTAHERLSTLSPRERQIFWLLARGRTNKVIATELNLSVKTVEDHRAAVLRKTNVHALAQLIDLAKHIETPPPQ